MAVICLMCMTVYPMGYLPGELCPNDACDDEELITIEEFMRIKESIKSREYIEDGNDDQARD